MNTVLTPPRPRSAQLATVAVVLVGFAVVIGVAVPVARLAASEPRSFRRLTVHNPTPYLVNVDVRGDGRAGWLDVGSFRWQQQRTVEEVADQGRRWVFRFTYGGVEGGELVLTRDELARDGWRITVPAAVTERLRGAGLPESAPGPESEARVRGTGLPTPSVALSGGGS